MELEEKDIVAFRKIEAKAKKLFNNASYFLLFWCICEVVGIILVSAGAPHFKYDEVHSNPFVSGLGYGLMAAPALHFAVLLVNLLANILLLNTLSFSASAGLESDVISEEDVEKYKRELEEASEEEEEEKEDGWFIESEDDEPEDEEKK